MVGVQNIFPFGGIEQIHQPVPDFGEHCFHPVEEPVQFALPSEKNAPQNETQAAVRIGLAIGNRKRTAPRSAEDQPALNTEVNSQRFYIRDQVCCRIVFEQTLRLGSAGAPLIVNNDPVGCGIKKPTMDRRCPRPRPAMQKNNRNSVRIS